MAKWRYKINTKEFWQKAKNDEITLQELAAEIARKMKVIIPVTEEGAEEIREQFEDIAQDSDANDAWFDDVMAQLYDWGDVQVGGKGFFDAEKRCWISTNF